MYVTYEGAPTGVCDIKELLLVYVTYKGAPSGVCDI